MSAELNIENIRYRVISRGEDQPESFPNIGDVIYLSVRRMVSEGQESDQVETAEILAENVEPMGHYSHVIGLAKVSPEEKMLYCDAQYETERKYPLGTRIGQLILKKVTYES